MTTTKTYAVKGDFLCTIRGDSPQEAKAKLAKLFEYAGIDKHSIKEARKV